MTNTDKAWEQWGQQDPYYEVMTLDRFRGGGNRAEFFHTGREDVNLALSRYERVFGSLRGGRALDYGCGVGRLTLALADHFPEVVGLDISDSMLREAGKNAAGRAGVKFAKADETPFLWPTAGSIS